MPWCDDCARFWNPNSMPPDGTCPSCGRVIGDPPDTSIPWHFWVLVAALVLYLGWRVIQFVQWLLERGQVVIAVLVAAATLAGTAALLRWFLGGRRAANEASSAPEQPDASDGNEVHSGPGDE